MTAYVIVCKSLVDDRLVRADVYERAFDTLQRASNCARYLAETKRTDENARLTSAARSGTTIVSSSVKVVDGVYIVNSAFRIRGGVWIDCIDSFQFEVRKLEFDRT